MPTNKEFQNVQLYINFNKEVTGATKLADSVLYSNLDPTGATNMAIEMAKIYTWAQDVFTFTPGETNKIMINAGVIPDVGAHYTFREGSTNGSFQVKEDDGAWQTIAVHNVATVDTNGKVPVSQLPDEARHLYRVATGTTVDSFKLETSVDGGTTWTQAGGSPLTLGILATTTSGQDVAGKVKSALLPSYVDDIVEGYFNYTLLTSQPSSFDPTKYFKLVDGKYVPGSAGDAWAANTWYTPNMYKEAAHTTKITGEAGKIYIDLPTNHSYRCVPGTPEVWVDISNPIDAATIYELMGITSVNGDFTGATSSANGVHGLVPAPATGNRNQYLRGDGTWATPTNTDTKVNVTLGTTTKAYLLGTSTTPTSSAQAVTSLADTGVYLSTNAGEIVATNFQGKINNHTVDIDVPSGAVFTDTTYSLSGTTYDTNNTAQIVTLTPSTGTATTATIAAMTGASSSAAGKAGLVPKPAAGDQSKFLRGDGTWATALTTDTKVTQSLNTDSTGKKYPLVLSYYEVGSSTTTAQTVSRKDTIYATPKDGSITATNFIGNINGLSITTPGSGDTTKFLKGDGTWDTPANTTYSIAGAYGTNNDTWVTTLTPSSGSATTSTVPTASTSVYGITKLSSSTSSTSEALAATPKAVKTAYDLAAGKSTVSFTRSYSTGTKIGTITINSTGTDIYIPSMTAATSSAAGTRGTVQAPAGSTDKYLRGDNTWVNPVDDIGVLTLHCTNGTT